MTQIPDQEIIDRITTHAKLERGSDLERDLMLAAERIRVLGEAIDEIAKEEDGGYGFYLGGDPRKFCPDEESCTPKELADHKAACEKWNEAEAKGEKLEPDPCGSGWISPTVHVTRSAYGLGSYTFPTNAARLAQAARAATDAARGGTR